MSTVIILGGGLQTLSVARSLKEYNHKVIVMSYNDSIVKRSNYIDDYIDTSGKSEQDLIAMLIDRSEACRCDVIIPMSDEMAVILSRNSNCFENSTHLKCAVADYDILRIVSDKWNFISFCKHNKIPHPKTELIEDNYLHIAKIVGFPAIIKPNRSVGARGITRVSNIDELKEKAPAVIRRYGECALQEYITSKDYYYNVMLYRSSRGEFANHVIIKIIRYYPIGGGSSSFCVTIENEEILNICKKTLDALNWTGFADFDILEKEDGDYRVIEINPRVPASLRAAAISGVNYPQIIVSDLLYNTFPRYMYCHGKQLRYLGLDIAWFFASARRFCCKPSWFKFFGKNLYYQEGGYRDMRAMIASLAVGVKRQFSSDFRKSKSGNS